MKKKKIEYGTENVLPDGEFNPADCTIRVPLLIRGDVLNAYKRRAKELNIDVKTLMEKVLKAATE